MKDSESKLTSLGSKETVYPLGGVVSSVLETFPNKYPGNSYSVEFTTQEFTSLCPITGQPDFATIKITYRPRDKCIETKSLKLYLFSYRGEKTFMESLTNRILNDLVTVSDPEVMIVRASFTPRGGISPVIEAFYESKKSD